MVLLGSLLCFRLYCLKSQQVLLVCAPCWLQHFSG